MSGSRGDAVSRSSSRISSNKEGFKLITSICTISTYNVYKVIVSIAWQGLDSHCGNRALFSWLISQRMSTIKMFEKLSTIFFSLH